MVDSMTQSMSFDKEIATNIIVEFLDEPLKEVTQIIGQGSVNKVFKVKTNTNEVILRYRDELAALEEYKKEAWCINQAGKAGIPVAEVIKVGKFGEIPYIIQSYIIGNNGKNEMVDPMSKWGKLGEYLSVIHSIKIQGFGLNIIEYKSGIFGDSFSPTWIEHVNYNISSLTEDDKLIELNVFEKSQLDEIKNIFIELKRKEFKFGLNHGDVALRNTIISPKGKIYLIDWGCALVNVVPYYDLMLLLRGKMDGNSPSYDEIQAFLNGYGISKSDFEEMKPDLYSIMLLEAFDKLRWSMDRSTSNIEAFAKYAKSILRQKLNN